jgi:hypothetical protein
MESRLYSVKTTAAVNQFITPSTNRTSGRSNLGKPEIVVTVEQKSGRCGSLERVILADATTARSEREGQLCSSRDTGSKSHKGKTEKGNASTTQEFLV